MSITFAAPSEQAGGQLLMQNAQAVSFARPSTAWGTWTHSAIYSAASGGEPVFIQALPETVAIKRGYMPTFAAGTVKVGIN